jgi:hypothetical protein
MRGLCFIPLLCMWSPTRMNNKNIRETTKEKENEAKNVNRENQISITKNV